MNVRAFGGRIDRSALAEAAKNRQVGCIQMTMTRPARRPSSLGRRDHGDSDTLKLILAIGMYILFYSNIYIFSRVSVCSSGIGEGGNDRIGQSKSVSADVTSFLGAFLNLLMEDLQRGGGRW